MKTKNIKRITTVGIVLFLLLICGCGNSGVKNNNFLKSYEYNPGNKAKREAKTYFKYLQDRDIQSLCELFSEEIRDTHDLETEWDAFYNVIDGNIESYEKISVGGEEMYVDDRKVTFSELNISFENVKTDTGVVYEAIDYCQIRVDNRNPASEGIRIFVIRIPADNDKGFYEVTVGGIINN